MWIMPLTFLFLQSSLKCAVFSERKMPFLNIAIAFTVALDSIHVGCDVGHSE